MGKQKLIITSFHKSTKRSYLQRMNNNKVVSMNKSKSTVLTIGMVRENLVMEDTNISLVD